MMQSPLMEHPGDVTLADVGRVPQDGIVYVLSRSVLVAREGSSIFRRGIIAAYKWLQANSLAKTSTWRIPPDDTIEVDLVHRA